MSLRRLRAARVAFVVFASCIAALTMRAQSAGMSSRPRLRLGGFTDVELHTATSELRGGVDLVDLDVYANAVLSDRWSVFGEGIAERYWTLEPEEQQVEVELDRLYLQYERTDEFRLEIGETQTGIIRWNERERRSRFLQTPIEVPAMARQGEEHGAWPLRFVGVWAAGRSHGRMGLAYGIGAGAGAIRTRDEIPLTSGEQSPAIFGSLSSAPAAIPGLEFGAAVFEQRLNALRQERFAEHDVTLSASYVNMGTEVRTEWARLDHRATGGRTYVTRGYYALVSKRLPGQLARLRPYLLYDRLNVAQGDPYLRESIPENAWAGGVRFDLTQRFTVKGEYRSQIEAETGGGRERVLGLQIGLSF